MSLTVHLEIGHDATLRTKQTPEGFTHDWEVFVRGCNGADIHYYVEKVVFYLHETFQKPKRVVKEPPFSLRTSGYAGFNLPIDIHLRNNQEPKKIRFNYDLQLQPPGPPCPPIHKIQKEKYTFHNPSEEFRSKLIKGGATLGVSSSSQEGIDTNRLIDEKNQMTSKPRLSGSDAAKKHKVRPEEPKNSDFLNLFGTPITKTSRNPEPPKLKEAPKSVPPKTVEKDKDKSEKAKSKSSHKDKDKEKKSETSDRKNREERKKPKDEKTSTRDRSKEKSSKKDKSPVTKVHSPSPKRSPKRPASSSPAPQKSGRKDLEHLKEEKEYVREEKRDKDKDRKDEKKFKKEKHKEHKESKHKERDKEKEHKEHKNKESSKENKSGKEVSGGKAKEEASPSLVAAATQSSQKTDKKEKLKEDRKESPKDEDKLRPDKPEQKHKHKKKDRKEKREEKHSKGEKRTEKQLNSAKHKENNKEPTISVRETDKNNLFGSPKSEPPSTPVQEEERKAENNVSYKDDDSSNESAKVSSRETSPVAKVPTRSPSPVVQKIEAEKTERKKEEAVVKKKEKKEKKKDKKGDKDHDKKKKRRSDTVTLETEQPPTKIQKEDENHISDDESKVSSTEDVNTVPKNECDMDMLRELQHKIMSLKDNADLQKVVQLIAETGRYEVSANTFDFDLCLLDMSTVKQLQEFMSTIT